MVYSGWPVPPDRDWADIGEATQQLFIIELSDPITAQSAPVPISRPEQAWERLDAIGINEGPQWLEAPDGSWRGLVYSCGPSWTQYYKMATLQLVGADPLDPACWIKSAEPLLQTASHGLGPFAPGHGSFLHTPQGETYALFHATDRATDGNTGRKARLQRVRWTAQGPDMDRVVGSTSLSEVLRMVALG